MIGEPSDELTSDQLSEIEARWRPFQERHERAAERLRAIQGEHLYFAIVGLNAGIERYVFEYPIGAIQRVVEPPGEIELAGALRDKTLMSPIGRYSQSITYELAIDLHAGRGMEQASTVAWWVLSALRIKTMGEFLVPAASTHSWSTISAVKDGDCRAFLVEDFPSARRLGKRPEVTREDLEWIDHNLLKFSNLLELPSFRLAVDSLTTHNHHPSPRLMAATLWAGIEALFGIGQELRFRLAAIVASVLEPRGVTRRELNGRIKRLYDVRSRAVHGSKVADEALVDHVCEVRQLLARLLRCFIEAGHLPTEAEWDDYLFC